MTDSSKDYVAEHIADDSNNITNTDQFIEAPNMTEWGLCAELQSGANWPQS